MTFNIIERDRERTTHFKSISLKADYLKNTEKKPTGLGLVKSSVHRVVYNLCSFLLGQEAEIRKIGPDPQENLRLIWRLFLSLTPNMKVYIFIIQSVNCRLSKV